MDWQGSPTAVTGCPPPNSDFSRTSCAWLVSWYSSSSTTENRDRSIPGGGPRRQGRPVAVVDDPPLRLRPPVRLDEGHELLADGVLVEDVALRLERLLQRGEPLVEPPADLADVLGGAQVLGEVA